MDLLKIYIFKVDFDSFESFIQYHFDNGWVLIYQHIIYFNQYGYFKVFRSDYFSAIEEHLKQIRFIQSCDPNKESVFIIVTDFKIDFIMVLKTNHFMNVLNYFEIIKFN